MNVEKILSEWLKKTGYTQPEAADLLKVSQATIHNWISGKRTPSLKHLPIIAQVCKVDISELLPPDLKVQLSVPSRPDERLEVDGNILLDVVFQSQQTTIENLNAKVAYLETALNQKNGQG
jgi:transcriptional regulator with XRE-family HTH domain